MVMSHLANSTTTQTSTMPLKARGFVIDKDSGYPLPGVVIVAVAEPDAGGTLTLGMLISDHAGYVSFDLDSLHELGVTNLRSLKHLWIYPVRDETAKVDLREVDQAE